MVSSERKIISALKVNQWLVDWNEVKYDQPHRKQPEPFFYIFKLNATELKALSGIQRRTTEKRTIGAKDLGIQRRHDKARSDNIFQYIKYGFPFSDLSDAKKISGTYDDLKKPGWLPTSIVVNILTEGDERNGYKLDPSDVIDLDERNETITNILLPKSYKNNLWKPKKLPPIEVIDGQHRLWAFEDSSTLTGDYELPVVAFHGLDISWQAYLFYTINIKPKRINASLAFDLYPLLRSEDWLEKAEGYNVYRETRAQEITEMLWSHSESPFYKHINMLGETGLNTRMVSQSAWIRSLMSTFIKSWEGKVSSIGGLYGSPVGKSKMELPWCRAQQAAFIIVAFELFRNSVKSSKEDWAVSLRDLIYEKDPAFYGDHTLINTDQGIRGMLYIINDLCYIQADNLALRDWFFQEDSDRDDYNALDNSIKSLHKKKEIFNFLKNVTSLLTKWDWRSSSADSLNDQQRTDKLVFRGSSGYKELRKQLLRFLIQHDDTVIGKTAMIVFKKLGYK